MRLRFSLPIFGTTVLLAAAGACSGGGGDARSDTQGGDTIAVPAAAVDTTRNTSVQEGGAAVTSGEPGAGTAATGTQKATGVDTPITRKLQVEDSARRDSAP